MFCEKRFFVRSAVFEISSFEVSFWPLLEVQNMGKLRNLEAPASHRKTALRCNFHTIFYYLLGMFFVKNVFYVLLCVEKEKIKTRNIVNFVQLWENSEPKITFLFLELCTCDPASYHYSSNVCHRYTYVLCFWSFGCIFFKIPLWAKTCFWSQTVRKWAKIDVLGMDWLFLMGIWRVSNWEGILSSCFTLFAYTEIDLDNF